MKKIVQECSNCRYFMSGEEWRECRKLSPSQMWPDGTGINGLWPSVLEGDWCGEWAERFALNFGSNDPDRVHYIEPWQVGQKPVLEIIVGVDGNKSIFTPREETK